MGVAIQTLKDITVPSEGGAAASLTSTSSKAAKKLWGQHRSLGLPTETKRALKAAPIFLPSTGGIRRRRVLMAPGAVCT